jgi:hypothetical protein
MCPGRIRPKNMCSCIKNALPENGKDKKAQIAYGSTPGKK